MEFHEVTNIFPMMSAEEFGALKADISANGLLEPIWTYEGKIIDGRNRFNACQETGVDPEFREWEGNGPLVSFVISLNLIRRHLNESQRAIIGAPLSDAPVGRPKKYLNCDNYVMTENEVAELFNVGRDTLRRAKYIIENIPEEVPAVLRGEKTVYRVIKEQKTEERKQRYTENNIPEIPPTIYRVSYSEFFQYHNECDLLITDPPYMTDVDDIGAFAAEWLPVALGAVKDTGRAYIAIGAYPEELKTYLNIEPPRHLILENVLVWTYRNTMGPQPKCAYKLNWQAVLYFRGVESPPLNCESLIELFTVQDINAPDGRLGDRFHTWQKPDELARRFIEHSTEPEAVVYDCFAGTGTFLIKASQLGRRAYGCDISGDMIAIAVERGCSFESRCKA